MAEPASFTDDESSQEMSQKDIDKENDPILSAINKIEKIDEDSNFGSVDLNAFNIESQNKSPSRKTSNDSDTDSDSDGNSDDDSDTDDDDEKEKIAFNFQQAKHPETDSDKSDDEEPVRIIRGAAPPTVQAGDYEAESYNTQSGSKPKVSPTGKKLNSRDIRQQKQSEYFEAKAESARLRRETDVQLPRHEKVLTLDDLKEETADEEEVQHRARARQRKREKLLKLVGNKAPTMGQGFLDMNPSLKKLQDQMIAHTTPVKRSPTKKVKITQAIKDEKGEIIDVKEIEIEQKVKEEKPLFVHSGKGSKLKKLKESLMTKLKENRIERFKEEKTEYESDIRNNEENYLDEADAEEVVSESDTSESDQSEGEDDEVAEQNSNQSDGSNSAMENSDDEIGKVRRKKKNKKKQFSDSEESENEDIPEPFSNQESMASSVNPYRNMSRLDQRNDEKNTPVTPERTSRSSSYQSTSPYSDFKLNFDLDDSISQLPDNPVTQGSAPVTKCDMDLGEDGENAMNIDESQFKRAVGIDQSYSTPDPSTQDVMNLAWTQTQPEEGGFPMKSQPDSPKNELPTKTEPEVQKGPEIENNEPEDQNDSDDGNIADTKSERADSPPIEEERDSDEDSDMENRKPDSEPEDLNPTPEVENDEPIIIKKKKKVIKKKPGFKMKQFEDIKEAEFDAEADVANVSGDEDETGVDEYENEEITEVLPSQRKMEKELKVIHNKLARDADAEELERVQSAFVGDEIDNAQRQKKRYKWILSNEFEGAAEKDSSDDDEPPSVEIQLKIEQEKLRERLEREKLLKESNYNEIGTFEIKTEPKPIIKPSTNIMTKSKLLKTSKSKRKDRLALAIADLKPTTVSKSMAFTSDSSRRKRNSDGFLNSASKKQKVPLLDKKKSLFLEID